MPKKTEYLHFSTTKLNLATSTQCPPKNRDFTAPLLINRGEEKKEKKKEKELFWIALESQTSIHFFCSLTQSKGTLPSRTPLFLKDMPTSLTQSTNYEQQMCIFFQTALSSFASHEKLQGMKLAVFRKRAHILNLPWFEKNQCICSKRLYCTHSPFVNLALFRVLFSRQKGWCHYLLLQPGYKLHSC